jgi:hypothetical protein
MDRAGTAWDRRVVEATTSRPVPIAVPAGLRALGWPAAAAVGGAVVVLVIVAAVVGGVPGGTAAWAAVAGACAGASGLILTTTGRAAPAAALGVAALAALVLAPAGNDRPVEAAPRALALQAPRPPTERSRGNAAPAPAVSTDNDPGSTAERSRGKPASPPAIGADDDPSSTGGRSSGDVAVRALVRSYYDALDSRRFGAAWGRLSPGVRAAFGGFASWRSGYVTTSGHRVEDVSVEREGGTTLVRHVLVATDRTDCGGMTERRFAVEWRLAATGGDWRADGLTARKVAGDDPAVAC